MLASFAAFPPAVAGGMFEATLYDVRDDRLLTRVVAHHTAPTIFRMKRPPRGHLV